LGACTELLTLACWHNKLLSLPAELGACTALTRLFCYRNQISSLPDELSQCTALHELYCGNNKLPSVPKTLGYCANLATLSWRPNPFEESALNSPVALRAWTYRRSCAVLLFCHEAAKQGDAGARARTHIGHVALDNIKEIAALVLSPNT
jgi:hypothetical protein